MNKLTRMFSTILFAPVLGISHAQVTANAPQPHPSDLKVSFDVLSDTGGDDLGPYMKNVTSELTQHWTSYVTVSELQSVRQQQETVLELSITPNGQIAALQLENPSQDVALDKAALAAARDSAYFPLPAAMKNRDLKLRVHFLVD